MLYLVTRNSDLAYGRYLGPETLLREAARLHAELGHNPHFRWRCFVDVLESNAVLRPVVRWREPQPVLVRMMAERNPGCADPQLAAEPDGPLLEARATFERAMRLWNLRDHAPQRLHPLDAPPPGSEAFLEDPLSAPWTPHTYDPVPAGRMDRGPLFDDNACVPLYRRWQVLQLFELSLGGPRTFSGLGYAAAAADQHQPPARAVTWFSFPQVSGFQEHRPTLEATSWFAAYAKLALQHSDSTPLRGNRFRIDGENLRRLREAEARAAREALERHEVAEGAVFGMLRWAGDRALAHGGEGRPQACDAYKALIREAVDMLLASGASFDRIRQGVPSGRRMFEELFPSWIGTQRQHVLATLTERVIPDLTAGLAGAVPEPNPATATRFLEWVEREGLLGLYSSFDALLEFGDRPDPDAEAGVVLHVLAISAWVEHACNALLAARPAAPSTATGLAGKLEQVWAASGQAAAFPSAYHKLNPKARGQPTGHTEAVFRARVRWLEAAGSPTGIDYAARDARMVLQIRNQAQHLNLAFLDREELVEAP
jgi:hypothetical protein